MSAVGGGPTTPAPVVVGYDASVPAEAALEWAAREARLRGAPLQVVYVRDAHDTHVEARPNGRELGAAGDSGPWPVVEEAAARARDVAPGVEAETFVEYASPVSALVGMSDGAALVVLGLSPHGPLREELRGSRTLQVAAHAHCPVAAVPVRGPDAAASPGAPVVVGYDGSAPAALALDHAADAAWRSGRGLRVVVAWRPGPVEWIESFSAGNLARDATEAAAEHTLAEGLARVRDRAAAAGWSLGTPEVEGLIRQGRAVDVLDDEAGVAERLVIGTRGRGGFAALLLGSVTHTLLRTASCPVVAVRLEG
jgi:nucleotide-binding universal stress UspA family protein